MKITDNIYYSCEVVMDVYENGKLIKSITKHNVLTNLGKLVIMARLCDPNPPYSHLNHMVFGDSITEPTILDNFDDFGYFYVNDTLGYKLNFVTEDSVEVFWELGESEYNGNTIRTVGLASDDWIFNRVNFPESDYTIKTPSVKIVGKWVIRITQS